MLYIALFLEKIM